MALDFKLSDEFVNSYKDKEVPWGYKDGAGNSLGEITTLRTYSRVKEDGTKEKWHEICRRVIEGMFTLQKRHARQNRIEWKNDKAQRTAKDAYDRMFNMKWLPPGRGIWSMGSPLVMDDNNSAPLQNCAACSSEESVVEAAVFLFDASMLGVGVGFDSLGANKFPVLEPEGSNAYVIPDSREGWVESLRLLLAAYIDEGKKRNPLPVMDYSEVRPAGAPIKRFGGIASGPGPLKDLHEKVKNLLDSRVGSKITMRDINDIMNMIGVAVIAGNVRRCLPEGTKVHLTDGLKNIEDVTPGDIVETTGRRAKVTKVFDQGVQETVLIKYDGGELECTPNHRVAVFDSLTSWTFKRADELTTKDRVVFDRNGYTGRYTSLPPSTVPVLKHNTTGVRIEVPPLTPDVAWLLGLIHGDGYVSVPPSGKNVGSNSGEVMIACSPDYPKVVEDSVLALSSFGVAALERTYSHDRATRVRAHSTELARYLLDFKTPTQTIEIPEYIVNGKREVRASYLAGLFDSDGSSKTRPLRALSTIYPDFADQVSSLYATLGIQARVKLSRPARGNWKDLYSVNIVGPHNIQGWADIVSPFSRKEPEVKLGVRSSGGATFDTDTVRRSSYRGSGIRCTNGTGSRKCAFRIEKALVGSLPALPYQVREVVPSGRSIQTYDIEVEDLHQFTANGIVVHNSAELSLVDSDSPDVQEFTDLKDYDKNPDRVGHGFMANNSIRVKVGDDYTPFLEGIKLNGEPGFVWKDISTSYSRLKDAPDFKDVRATLVNPCSEQNLESGETCTLCEVFIGNCTSQDDFIKTLKVAYMYGKTVTLLPTKWEKTNAILLRNRRIGLSVSGVADYVDTHGLPSLRKSLDDGYDYVMKLDKKYSEWLCVRESVKHTTVKPAGSISLVAGSSPGVHWTPGGEYFIRRITFAKTDPIFEALKDAGYEHSDLEWDPKSAVILFPIHSKSKRSAADVPAWEKINLAAEMQHWWSDNAVSCTVDFKPAEAGDIPKLLNMYEGRLKGISFLPAIEKGAYKNMPYEQISKDTYEEMKSTIRRADFTHVYSQGIEAVGEAFCTSDKCETEIETNAMTLEVPTINLDEV